MLDFIADVQRIYLICAPLVLVGVIIWLVFKHVAALKQIEELKADQEVSRLVHDEFVLQHRDALAMIALLQEKNVTRKE